MSEPRAPSRSVRALVCALLALAVLATFAGVRHCGFTDADDPQYVWMNAYVKRGLTWEGVRWAFTTGHAANWHPLTWLSHMLDVELFGLAALGHHATSVALHAANAVLCLLALEHLTRRFWPSAAVALLFAVHPLRVESVAWVSERKDVLCAFFFFTTLIAYARYIERPCKARYAVVAASLALGLMAKPMLVTLPCLLLVLDAWPLDRARERGAWARLVREKAPLFALVVLSSIATFLAQKSGGAVASVESIPLGVRVLNAVVSCGRYVAQLAWPADLCVYYPYPRGGQLVPFVLAAAGIVLAAVLVVRQRARRPYLFTGLAWFLGLLVPVIGLVQVGSQAHADRYTYLPAIGLLIALVWLAADALARAPRWLGPALTIAAAAPLAIAANAQVAHWRDSETLFERALAVTDDNGFVHHTLGTALSSHGRTDEALPHLEEALRLLPGSAIVHNGLGAALFTRGDDAAAEEHLRRAVELDGRYSVARYNLGLVLEKRGDLDGALAQYAAAAELDPLNAAAHAHAAKLHGARGRLDESLESYRRAKAIERDDVELARMIAVTLTLQGKAREALAEYEQLLALAPDDADALNNIAWMRATHSDASVRDGAEAVRRAERVRDLLAATPNAIVLDTLAAAYAEAGRFADAVASCEAAVALAEKAGETRDAARFREHLALFKSSQPLRMR